jgi:hypothetical protein
MFSRHINSPAALSQSGFTGDVLAVTTPQFALTEGVSDFRPRLIANFLPQQEI